MISYNLGNGPKRISSMESIALVILKKKRDSGRFIGVTMKRD
jgi:hypothetical protein